ncbi:tetratricopeptide repeat protein 36 homolog [Cylas formicarius]|uniref:tetratricopeptide repeat protein 36 homolog n=1 Tax=Cylas formicarius TaxID=197179 RepID=UPI0029589EB1|nr:tetratricopeptide repeat protein 36 homolog [Cylas formicarius]
MEGLCDHDKAVLTCIFNPHLPIVEAYQVRATELKDDEEQNDLVLKTKKMEMEAVERAEKGDLEFGLQLLTEAINIAPERPSLYNNRAGVFQYMRRFDEALNDLSTAIKLCTDKHQKTTCRAHLQRGLLHRRADDMDQARRDFEVAAKMGSTLAKSQLIEINPYAALCNQMLKQVMEKLN